MEIEEAREVFSCFISDALYILQKENVREIEEAVNILKENRPVEPAITDILIHEIDSALYYLTP